MSGRWVSCFNSTYVHLIFNSTHPLNRIAGTFTLVNIAVFEANFKDSVTCFWDLIADELGYLKVIS